MCIRDSYIPVQLEQNPQLKAIPEVKDNPNCFPMKVEDSSQFGTQLGTYSISRDELLFINYMTTNFNENDPSQNKFELQFFIKNKKQVNSSDQVMLLYTIPDIPVANNNWTFFAVCADYEIGKVLLYAKTLGIRGTDFLAHEKLSFKDFSLNQGSLLLIGAVHKNNYFKSVTGFMGETAYIQMSPEFLPNPPLLWISEMLPEAASYKGVNTDLFFDVFQKNTKQFKGKGINQKNVSLTGKFVPLYLEDQNQTGIKFPSESGFQLGNFPFKGSPFVTSNVFFFNILYQEPLPDKHPLLFKNKPGL